VQTDGKPACALEGINELNPAEAAAFENFWQNAPVPGPQGAAPGPGLQDHYLGALSALARRFEHDPAVVGYELMNEPQPGSLGSVPVADAYQASAQELYPFYRRAIEALTGVRDGLPTCPAAQPTSLAGTCAYPAQAGVHQQSIYFEPLAYRNLVDFSLQVSRPFSSYPNLVFAPHIYTDAFTIEQEFLGLPAKPGGFPPSFTFGYQTAQAEAQAMHAAVFVTEFGDGASTDPTVLTKELAAQDATRTGSTLWAWKGLSNAEGSCWCVRWQHSSYQTTANGTEGKGDPHATPSPDDRVIPSRLDLLARVWPRAVAGRLRADAYDPASRSFELEATAPAAGRRGDRAGDTEVSVPAGVPGPVRVMGRAALDAVVTAPDGSRLVYVTPSGPAGGQDGGGYAVTVGNPPAALRQQVDHLAQHPLPPIAEPQARALAEQALAHEVASPNAALAAKAKLVQALAGLVLGPSDPVPPGPP
jgi:endoglycosylceramidase